MESDVRACDLICTGMTAFCYGKTLFMNPRERYIETLRFGTPDRIPFQPGKPREKTLKRWHSEGLSENIHWYDALCEALGIGGGDYHKPTLQAGVNFRMNPVFEEKVLEHKDGHYVVQDWMGNVVEISDEYDYTYIREPKDFVTRRWIAFPVNNRDDFEKMKKRYDPDDSSRYPEDFDLRVRRLRDRRHIVTLQVSGPFWQLREWCGFEPLCMLFMDDPAFVREMIGFYADFVSRNMMRVLEAGIVDVRVSGCILN